MAKQAALKRERPDKTDAKSGRGSARPSRSEGKMS